MSDWADKEAESIELKLRWDNAYDRDKIAAALRQARSDALEEAMIKAYEARCERGTPWDLACVYIAEGIAALKDKP